MVLVYIWYTFAPTLLQRIVSVRSWWPPTNHLHSICTMLVQRRKRGADVVQMLYKYFVLAGVQCILPVSKITDDLSINDTGDDFVLFSLIYDVFGFAVK